MELLNLKTFSKNIAATKLKQSLKVTIRDVDEETKNNFVAYADEKGNSYDVSIEIDADDNVVESNCDCEIKGLCIHSIAFMVYLSNRSDKPKVIRIKKQTPLEILINNLDANVLRFWVYDLLKKNKDIAFLFESEFTINIEEYTKPKVKSIIDNSIKSVIKTRKNIEANELKKVIDLLEVTLKPVLDFCKSDLAFKDNLEIVFFIFDELVEFNNRIYSTSIKLIRFIEKLSNDILLTISSILDDEKWQKIADLHFELILNENVLTLNNQNFNHIKSLYKTDIDNDFRKKYFAQKIKNFAEKLAAKNLRFDVEVDSFMLEVLFENNLFETTYILFKAVKYQNDYNLSLIDKLISINKINEAEEMALAQVANNYYVDFNFPYWQKLKSIYVLQGNDSKLANILINTVPIELNYDDYLIVKNAMPEADFKQYRSNLLGRTKRNFHSTRGATTFYFKLLAEQNNYKKMLETVSEFTDYDLIYEYRLEMYNEDKIQFLKAICQVQSNDYFRKKVFNEEFRDKLTDWVFENYDKERIQSFLNTYLQRMDSVFLNEIAIRIQIMNAK